MREPSQALPTDAAIKVCAVLLKPKRAVGAKKDVNAGCSCGVFERRQDFAFHCDGDELVS